MVGYNVPPPGRPDRMSDRMSRETFDGVGLHPNLHQKAEGSSTATSYNYTRDRERTEKRLERI
jgi:hypothetical protein